ncbi:NAD(P)H-dependent oxidoreductase [Sinanaerobacter chloroacetimidivorans]|uniref:NAD(P)H-dependent oxidoreductase n=1 Tax=Sinanaerobacter chloroacetimidivorans TaxID=2818044 RepID=A0A8J8B3N5_9FIRM|nr:NAD(P)H-dependent oxidoreductase [Sinanaerobacter chloroacetimidivorans]MBR0599966.1 NAD(P)H-dependent oxidoreductase [Sinanaerobacter chloroacetimidivorans]
MKLTIYNCSPKPGRGNTDVLLEHFIKGFQTQEDNVVQLYKLNKLSSMEEAVKIFEASEAVLIAFPLYCYAMPGGLKLFIEALEPLCRKCNGKKLGFLVQYGFIEAVHGRPVEKYNQKLASLLGCQYFGTVIKGGCDGLITGKTSGMKKIMKGIHDIGETLSKTGEFDQAELDTYSAPELEKKQNKLIMKVVLKLINRYYWGAMLKKNGVTIDESYARPYEISF